MYQVNDLVIYGNEGVCRVAGIGEPEIGGVEPGRLYYRLEPLFKQGKIYTPVDTGVFMRPALTGDEASRLIDGIPDIRAELPGESTPDVLDDLCRDLWQTHDCANLVRMVELLLRRKKHMAGIGKKIGQVEGKLLEKAEDALSGELAVALHIPKENVATLVARRVGLPEENGGEMA